MQTEKEIRAIFFKIKREALDEFEKEIKSSNLKVTDLQDKIKSFHFKIKKEVICELESTVNEHVDKIKRTQEDITMRQSTLFAQLGLISQRLDKSERERKKKNAKIKLQTQQEK